MAWFKKAASAVNDHYDVATELTVALAPSIRRGRKLEERGTPANGVITGIHFSLSNETTRKEFAVSVLDGNGSQRFGVRTQPTEAHRLRLRASSSLRNRCVSRQQTASSTRRSMPGCIDT